MSIVLKHVAKVDNVPQELKQQIAELYSYQHGKTEETVVNYIYKRGTFYLPPNLHKLQIVASLLDREIIDRRSEGLPLTQPFTLSDAFTFRPHQAQPSLKLLEYIKKNQYGVLKAPCSCGKTVMLSYVAGQLGHKVLITVDLDIKDQWDKAFQITYNRPVMQLSKGMTEFPDVAFATLQFLYKNPELLDKIRDVYGCLLVDEMHSLGQARTFKHVIYRLNNKFRIGTTATFEFKNFPSEILTDTISGVSVTVRDTDALIPDVYFVKTNVDFCSEDPYDMSRINKELGLNRERNELLISRINHHSNDKRKIIVVCNSQEQMDLICPRLETFCKPVKFSSKTPKKIADKVPKDFEEGVYDVILVVKKGEKAVDLPSANCLIIARPINKDGTLTQYRGRIERNAEGKRTPIFEELVDTTDELANIWTKPFEQKTLAEVFSWKHRNRHKAHGCSVFDLN